MRTGSQHLITQRRLLDEAQRSGTCVVLLIRVGAVLKV